MVFSKSGLVPRDKFRYNSFADEKTILFYVLNVMFTEAKRNNKCLLKADCLYMYKKIVYTCIVSAYVVLYTFIFYQVSLWKKYTQYICIFSK